MAVLVGTSGDDTIFGTGDADVISGLGGQDRLAGLGGDDTIGGGPGNDRVEGNDGDDGLEGMAGDDLLVGGRGSDAIFGGDGNDRLMWNNGDGSDRMDGGAGYDIVEVNGADGPGDSFVLGGGGAEVMFDRVNLIPFRLDIDNVEQIDVNGLAGDDRLTVGDLGFSHVGLVNFDGGAGSDVLDGAGATRTLRAKGDAGDDRLTGGTAVDRLEGGDGDDVLRGNDGADVLLGDGGNDLLVGGRGDDTMSGGAGDDRLMWNNGDNSDRMDGGAGMDVVEVNGAGVGDVFTLGRGGADLLFDRLNLIPFRLDIDRVERLEVNGLDGDDRFTFTGLGGGSSLQGVRFDGGTGDDVLDASTADRFVFGKGGDGRDVLEGGIADDLLQGGAGDDRLDGGAGRDLLHGGAGADTFSLFTADGGRDVIDDFELGTDVLEVRGLTPFYRPGVSDPNDFLQFTDAGGSTTIAFDLPGGGPFLDLVTLRGVSGVTFETLDAAGSILIV